MDTITKKRKKIILVKKQQEHRIGKRVFLREEQREGIGTVAVFSNGDEIVVKPTRNYNICSRLIDRIFAEKVYKKSTITQQNIVKHVA